MFTSATEHDHGTGMQMFIPHNACNILKVTTVFSLT